VYTLPSASLSSTISILVDSLHHPPGHPPAQPSTMDQSTDQTTWTKVSHKRGHSSADDIAREPKHAKDSQHWLHPPSTTTSNRYSPLAEAHGADRPQQLGPKPPPIYIQDIITISLLLQLLEQVAPRDYETKALTQNQVKVQPKTSDAYRVIVKALADRHRLSHL
jgi:hypothetical protein